jgi:hypothetical protein
MLIPARTDTAFFHDHIYNRPDVEIRFVRGRLKFGDSKNSAPFPSMVVVLTRFDLCPTACPAAIAEQITSGKYNESAGAVTRANGRRCMCHTYVPNSDVRQPANQLIGRLRNRT